MVLRTTLLLVALLALGPAPDASASRRWVTVTSIAELVMELDRAQPGVRLQLRGSNDATQPKTFNDAYLHLDRVRGTEARPIRIRFEPGTYAALSTPETDAAAFRGALVLLENCAHVHLHGLTLQDHASPALGMTATGVHVVARRDHPDDAAPPPTVGIQLTSLVIRRIKAFTQEAAEGEASKTLVGNAHGILVKSEEDDLAILRTAIRGCAVRDLTLGWSEAISLDGNVDDFLVAGNVVANCDNIGIDAIGGYKAPGSNWDCARNGRIVGNIVRGCSSADNAAYDGALAAGGIYLDGAHRVRVEDNIVIACDHGIEIGCEKTGHVCKDTVVTGNEIRDCLAAALVVGSNGRDYDKAKGTQDKEPSTGSVRRVRIEDTVCIAPSGDYTGSLIELLRMHTLTIRHCTFILSTKEASLVGQHLVDAPCHALDFDSSNHVRVPAEADGTIRVRFSRSKELPGHTLPGIPATQTWAGVITWTQGQARSLGWRVARPSTQSN